MPTAAPAITRPGLFRVWEPWLPDVPDPFALITASQAATYAGVSVQAVLNWRRRGHLAMVNTPEGPRYRLVDVARAEHATRRRARR